MSTLQSTIVGKMLRENASAGRAKLRREFRVPISNNYAHLSICRPSIIYAANQVSERVLGDGIVVLQFCPLLLLLLLPSLLPSAAYSTTKSWACLQQQQQRYRSILREKKENSCTTLTAAASQLTSFSTVSAPRNEERRQRREEEEEEEEGKINPLINLGRSRS